MQLDRARDACLPSGVDHYGGDGRHPDGVTGGVRMLMERGIG
jgi:hypothetical protein